jgi:hypothetical protein
MGQICPGDRFVLQGLRAQPAFNGQHVIVVEYLHDQDRYRVQPADPNGPLPPTLAIRQQNLVPVAGGGGPPPEQMTQQGQFAPGARFVLQGLQAQPAFNGQHVLVVEYMHDQDRYCVQPADPNGPLPPTLAIRAQNLAPASASGPTSRQTVGNSPMPPMPPEISIPENNDTYGSKSEILPVGSTAVLHGLKSQAALNGEMVVIDAYMEDEGRYRVSPVDSTESSMPVLAIKPQNLLPCKDPRRRERNASDASSSFGSSASSSSGSQVVGSQHSSSSRSKSKSNASMDHLKPGSHARLTGLKKKPKLNGHMVRIVEYLRDKDRYRVEPLDVEAFDVCTADLMAIRPKNLISEDPMHGSAAPLAPGTRAVLINLSGKPAFSGQLVTIVRYLVENGTYEVRTLGGRTRNGASPKVLFLGPDKIKPAPQSAFWVQMTIKGHQLRLPVSCKVQRDKIGQANVHVMLDAFAGLDQVIPAAKVILGEDHCDWMDDGEVLAALKASKSQTITLDIQNKEAHAGLKRDEAFISEEKKPAIFEAMVEFELIKPTKKTVQVDLMGTLLVYKLKFPDSAQTAKALETKRPSVHRRSSTSSVMSSKSVQSSQSLFGSRSLHSSSSSVKPRSKMEKANKSEWKESQSVAGSVMSASVPNLKKASRRQSLQCSSSSVVSRPNSIQKASRRQSMQGSSSSVVSRQNSIQKASRRQSMQGSSSSLISKPNSIKKVSRRQSMQCSSSSIISRPNSIKHLLVRSNSDDRRPQMEPPGSTHIPIRERASSQEEPVDDDDSFAGDEDSSHSPKSVACAVPKEVGAKKYSSPPSRMGDSYASLTSELEMQDLFLHIEAKEKEKQDLEKRVQKDKQDLEKRVQKEKQDLEKSVQQIGRRLSMVQMTCEAATHKLTLLRGGPDASGGKDVKEICASSDSKSICDSSSSSDSDDDDDDDDE